MMKGFIGFLAVAGAAGYFWARNPQATPWILGIGAMLFRNYDGEIIR